MADNEANSALVDNIADVISSFDPDADGERFSYSHAREIAQKIIDAGLASPEVKPDMFWDADNNEVGRDGIHEIVENYDLGEIVKVQQAARFADVFAARVEDGDDWEVLTADTAEELQAKIDALQPKLWCCHVRGPDDVMACDDKAHAERVANAVNTLTKATAAENDVLLDAVAAPWPHTAEAHAHDLANPSADYADLIVAMRAQPAVE